MAIEDKQGLIIFKMIPMPYKCLAYLFLAIF